MSTEEPTVERPEDEDYDLLTYGEVAARLAEVLAEERRLLADLQAATSPDAAAIAVQEKRIADLVAGRERYEHQAETAETFVKRFGLTPRTRD
jgi:plasmid maintenance system antidote protein VapI